MLSRRSTWFRRFWLSEASSKPGSSVKLVGVNWPSSYSERLTEAPRRATLNENNSGTLVGGRQA
jgi:hypothetical protein